MVTISGRQLFEQSDSLYWRGGLRLSNILTMGVNILQ